MASLATEHLNEVFSWFVEGAKQWYKDGEVGTCAAMEEHVRAYRKAEDSVQLFLDQMCVLSPQKKTRLGELFSAYAAWCHSNKVSACAGEVVTHAHICSPLNAHPLTLLHQITPKRAAGFKADMKIKGIEVTTRNYNGVAVYDPDEQL